MIESKKAKFNYDYDTDSYSVIPIKRRYDSSVQIGDFVLDIDEKNNLTGVEILNISRILKISKAFLINQVGGQLEVVVTKDFLKLNLTIRSVVRNSDKTSVLSVERAKPEFLEPAELNFGVA